VTVNEVEFLGGPVDGRIMVIPSREEYLRVDHIIPGPRTRWTSRAPKADTEGHQYRRDPANPARFIYEGRI
jgi:hypothetical protein